MSRRASNEATLFLYEKSLSINLQRDKKNYVQVISFYSTDKQLILDRHNEEACYKFYCICHQYIFDMVKYGLQNSVILNFSHNFPKRFTFLKINLFSWRYNPLWLYFHSPVAGFSLLVFEVS
jgi:hypothetical protein